MENTAQLLGNLSNKATAFQHAFAEALAAKKTELAIENLSEDTQTAKEFVQTPVSDNTPLKTQRGQTPYLVHVDEAAFQNSEILVNLPEDNKYIAQEFISSSELSVASGDSFNVNTPFQTESLITNNNPEIMQSETTTLTPTTISDITVLSANETGLHFNTSVSIIENSDPVPSNPNAHLPVVTKDRNALRSEENQVRKEQLEFAAAQAQEDEGYPDPTKVLEGVEDRLNVPRKQKSPIKKHKDTQAQSTHDVEHKPNKRPAIFGLAPDRQAGQLLKNIFNPATLEGQDGVDHINIHNDAATELGLFLDMNAKSPFNHPELGMFQAVGGVWHYIQTQPLVEEYRILTGAKLRAKVAKVKEAAYNDPNAPRHTLVKGFRIIVADAMWHKVTQNEKAVQMMAETTLPFEHYFVQGDMKIRQYPSEGYWIIAAYEEIRRVIKARLGAGDPDEQPNFSHIESLRDPRASVAPKPQRRDMPYGQRPRSENGYYQNR
jgi:hypothetical protein